jgi:hypothetical protein
MADCWAAAARYFRAVASGRRQVAVGSNVPCRLRYGPTASGALRLHALGCLPDVSRQPASGFGQGNEQGQDGAQPGKPGEKNQPYCR